MWWTCEYNTCSLVFWADREPHNGHRLSCGAHWNLGCPMNGEPCKHCMTEAKIAMIVMDRLVNGVDKGDR